MSAEHVDLAIKAITFFIAIGSGVYAWFATRRKDVDRRMERIADRIFELDQRVTDVEKKVDALPGTDDVNQLMLAVTGIRGAMDTMSAKLDGQKELLGRVETAVSIHQEHLMKGSAR